MLMCGSRRVGQLLELHTCLPISTLPMYNKRFGKQFFLALPSSFMVQDPSGLRRLFLLHEGNGHQENKLGSAYMYIACVLSKWWQTQKILIGQAEDTHLLGHTHFPRILAFMSSMYSSANVAEG